MIILYLTVNKIADAVAISREGVENIFQKELGMSKVSARWVSRLLTPDQKHTRLVVSQANLAVFETDRESFLESSFAVSSPKMSVGSITLKQRPNGYRCSGNTILLPLQRSRRCAVQGR